MRKREDSDFKKHINLTRDRMKATGACAYATARFMGKSPEAINHGFCFEFATIVFDLLEGSKIAGHNVNGCGHTWIEYRGLCWDAEVIHGIKDWRDLPFWQRLKKEAGAKEFNRTVRRLG